ncbi:MAG: hypothetical protein D6797_06195 [Bdellovibrio sp.]|nr:MAG: hypothetical protein D6797_06195 [Bdellovibrio sp.]
MKSIILAIEAFQKRIDLEKFSLWGISLDRYAHFLVGASLWLLFRGFFSMKKAIFLLACVLLFKEVLDLGVILYYEPINSSQWTDSFWDLGLGIGGAFCVQGLWGFKKVGDRNGKRFRK